MIIGFLFGLFACLLWGTVYVVPAMISEYSPLWIALLRYTIFGAACLAILVCKRNETAKLTRSDWILATMLGVFGNLVYYWVLSCAVVRIGPSLCAVFSALIPLTASLAACFMQGTFLATLKKLLLPLALIGAGLVLLNLDNLRELFDSAADINGTWIAGVALAVLSVVLWTWYPLSNAAWMKKNPEKSVPVWTAAQGATVLPISAIGFALLPVTEPEAMFVPSVYAFLLVAFLAIICSLVGNLCWNKMSSILPPVIVGQMIVFETLSAIGYESILKAELPGATVAAGSALVLAGVSMSLLKLGKRAGE